MYPLLPWKSLGSALTAIVMISVYADDLARLLGTNVSDQNVVRYVPLGVLAVLAGFFGPTGYWAPWRLLWRLCPALNRWIFPDLNGVWIGCTHSNWPTVAKMLEAAKADWSVSEGDLHAVQEQRDAIAVRVSASLFRLSIAAGLSSTDGQSYSITARPWREQNSDRLHLTYVYEQRTPDPALTDEECHMGAADLVLDLEDLTSSEGVYWTRRRWKVGLNTAGKLQLKRLTNRKDPQKTLRQYAAVHKAQV